VEREVGGRHGVITRRSMPPITKVIMKRGPTSSEPRAYTAAVHGEQPLNIFAPGLNEMTRPVMPNNELTARARPNREEVMQPHEYDGSVMTTVRVQQTIEA